MPASAPLRWDNEEWTVVNVPSAAQLVVSIHGQDSRKTTDDLLGECEVPNLGKTHSRAEGHPIVGSFGQHLGRLYISIEASRSSNGNRELPRYTFDGPCRYSRVDSLLLDRFSMRPTDGISTTWKIQLRRIPLYFPPDEYQQWTRETKSTLHQLPTFSSISSAASRTVTSTARRESGRLTCADDLWKLIFVDKMTGEIQPRIFTYVIGDHLWQFTETGYRLFGTLATKHKVLGNDSSCLRCAGEFHMRPKLGWTRTDGEWEIVFDNASGTFAPKADVLVKLKQLMLFNFPGLNIITYDYKDPALRDSVEQLEMAVRRYERKNKAAAADQYSFSRPSFT